MNEKRAISVAAALQAEPLFHMSLGSKELFHSNLVAWFVDRYPEDVGVRFAAWTPPAPGRLPAPTTRETGDLDIVIQLADHEAIVIENKAFSMPNEAQLERYAAGPVRALRGRPTLVLLSLSNPRWPSDEYAAPAGTWRRIGYETLREVLQPAIEAVRRRDFYDGETLAHYCSLLRLLVELADLVDVGSDDEPVELEPAITRALMSARIADAAEKMRMYQIAGRLRQALTPVRDVAIKADFTNGKPLLEAFVPLRGTDRIGWQYQNGQFRVALILDTMSSPGATRAQREAFATAHYGAWLELGRLEQRFAPTRPVARRTPLNGYDPAFVYRYCIPVDLNVGRLLKIGAEYVADAVAFAARAHPREAPPARRT